MRCGSALGPLAARRGLGTGATRLAAGLPTPKIADIQTITAPNRIRLVVVKVLTSEPGLYGWGCATFTQRALVVKTAIDEYLRPFLIGRRVDEIEDIYHSSYVSSYWRNGPVLFNAMSGIDLEPPDRLHPHPHLADWRALGRTQGRSAVRVRWRAHGAARPW